MNPVLMILPQGPTIGGATTWVCRSADCLVNMGHDVTVFVHGSLAGHTDVSLPLDRRVRLIADPSLPAPHTLAGRIETVTARYARLTEQAARDAGAPVVVIPTRDADCFAACAALAARRPEQVRLLGWRHSPMPYERAIFARYACAMSGMAAVSDELADELRRDHPARARDIARIHNAVAIPGQCPPRPSRHGRPLQLIYTGRLDEPIKRVTALVHMSDALRAASIEHRVSIVGDGPARDLLRSLAAERSWITLTGATDPGGVCAHLSQADVFVLPSRVEGLSMAALEAMAHGCALMLARTRSGATDLVGDDEAGLIADTGPTETSEQAGLALADGIGRLAQLDVGATGRSAYERALRLFSLERYARQASELIQRVAHAEPICLSEPVGPFHTLRPASVPPDADERLRTCLSELSGRRVAVFGCGAHTRALRDVFVDAPARIVAFSDDDPSMHGTELFGRPVVAPDAIADTGATDVIISSWLHEEDIWARRMQFEQQHLRVHRLYGPVRQPA